MKAIKQVLATIILSILALSLNAQNTISVKNQKLVSPLVSKWVSEYKNVNPGLKEEAHKK